MNFSSLSDNLLTPNIQINERKSSNGLSFIFFFFRWNAYLQIKVNLITFYYIHIFLVHFLTLFPVKLCKYISYKNVY